MDFTDGPEHAAFRSEFRSWLETNLPPEICVDDAADQRVAADRETLEKRLPGRRGCTPPAGSGSRGPRNMAGAVRALCSR
jgi:hypothetical protein